MFGRRKKKITRQERLRLKAAHAAGQLAPHVSRVTSAAADKVGPQLERARDYAGPRLSALAATTAVAVAPRLKTAKVRGSAALDALRGVEMVPVRKKKRRKTPLMLGTLGVGIAAVAAARAFRQPELVPPMAPMPAPTVVPDPIDVVVLHDAHASDYSHSDDN